MNTTTKSKEQRSPNQESPLKVGHVDFFEDRFGFIVPEDGVTDTFIRWTVLRACKVRPEDMAPGRKVKFKDKEGLKGPNRQATYVELV
jgi:cold shock CspA family protein